MFLHVSGSFCEPTHCANIEFASAAAATQLPLMQSAHFCLNPNMSVTISDARPYLSSRSALHPISVFSQFNNRSPPPPPPPPQQVEYLKFVESASAHLSQGIEFATGLRHSSAAFTNSFSFAKKHAIYWDTM